MSEDTSPSNINSIPQFIRKLFNILGDPRHSEHIHWSHSGDSFIIVDPIEFCNTVLTSHFKHSNISSFIRQLNKYDFHKIRNIASAKRKSQNRMWEFKHPNFIRSRPELLNLITRKTVAAERAPQNGIQEMDMDQNVVFQNYVINAISNITKYFEMITEDLNGMKKILHRQYFGGGDPSVKTLVAEDNATCSSYATLIFKRMNFLTVSVESISDFSFFFNNEKFDLILISSQVPNIKDLLSTIRSKNGVVPIILTTDEKDDIQSLYYRYPVVNKILVKPYSHEELIGFVKSLNISYGKPKDEERMLNPRHYYT